MSELKITDAYLDEFVKKEIPGFIARLKGGDTAKDPLGALVINALTDFAAKQQGSNLVSGTAGTYSKLMGGQAPLAEAVRLQTDFGTFCAAVKAQFDLLVAGMDKAGIALHNAGQTLHNANDEALSLAQMMTVLGGATPTPSTTQPPTAPPAP